MGATTDMPERVPGANRAKVPDEKLAYLCDEGRRARADPRARSAYKAGIFCGVPGFVDARLLRDRLLEHVRGNRPVRVVRDLDHRLTKYVVEGPLVGENGRSIGMMCSAQTTVEGIVKEVVRPPLIGAYVTPAGPDQVGRPGCRP